MENNMNTAIKMSKNAGWEPYDYVLLEKPTAYEKYCWIFLNNQNFWGYFMKALKLPAEDYKKHWQQLLDNDRQFSNPPRTLNRKKVDEFFNSIIKSAK